MSKKQLIKFYTLAILFWVVGIPIVSDIMKTGTFQWSFKDSYFTVTQLIYVTVICLLTLWLFRNSYFKVNWITSIRVLLGLYFTFVGTRYFIEEFLSPRIVGFSNYYEGTTLYYYFLDNVYYGGICIAFAFALALFDNQVHLQKERSELLQSYQEAQLAYLRAQISPHFLFNALNSIYALAYKKSDDTPKAVLELSELLRYVLQPDDKGNTVQKEWEVIMGYIHLQKLRTAQPLFLDIKTEGDLSNFYIPPYLLIPLVENAFKHGDLSSENQPFIFHLKIEGKTLSLFTQNKIHQYQKDSQGGVGLNNIKKRLSLLYSNRHQLEIQEKENLFSVQLQITNL